MSQKDSADIRFSHIRSISKAISWRVVATTTTILAAYFITGEVDTALTIGGIEAVAKMFLYYAHERAWIAIPWGVTRRGDNVVR